MEVNCSINEHGIHQKKSISIIVPVYNMEDKIRRCLDSIINQTFSDIEIILVNDGSKDKSGEICDEYSKKDNRIQVIHKGNGGVSSARNLGLELAKGKYISFVDPDDYLSLDMLQKLHSIAEKMDCDIISCCPMVITPSGTVKNSFFNGEHLNPIEVDKSRSIMQLTCNAYLKDAQKLIDIGVPWGKLYKNTFLISNNIKFNPALKRMQDNIFNLYAFQKSEKTIYIDQALYFYDYSNISSAFNKYIDNLEDLLIAISLETKNFLTKYKWLDEERFKVALNVKNSMLLLQIIKVEFFHKYNGSNFIIKLKRTKELVESDPFKSSIRDVDLSYFSFHNKVLIKLLKSHNYILFLVLSGIVVYLKRLKCLSN